MTLFTVCDDGENGSRVNYVKYERFVWRSYRRMNSASMLKPVETGLDWRVELAWRVSVGWMGVSYIFAWQQRDNGRKFR